MSEENKTGGPTNSGSGRQVNMGGGSYNEGTINNNNSGGVNISGGTVRGGVHYTDNRISAGDNAKIEELFKALQGQIQAAPAATPQEEKDKTQALKAADGLKQEIEAVKKDPKHEPNEFTMQGFIAAFKKLGAPVFSAAMTLIGQPALGMAVNGFAQALPEPKE